MGVFCSLFDCVSFCSTYLQIDTESTHKKQKPIHHIFLSFFPPKSKLCVFIFKFFWFIFYFRNIKKGKDPLLFLLKIIFKIRISFLFFFDGSVFSATAIQTVCTIVFLYFLFFFNFAFVLFCFSFPILGDVLTRQIKEIRAKQSS